MNGYDSVISIDKLKNSLNVLHSLEACLSSVDLSGIIIDIEKRIKTINFEHGNCIVNYKETIDYILDEITNIKKDISILENMTNSSIKSFTNLDSSDSIASEEESVTPVIIRAFQDASTNISKIPLDDNSTQVDSTSLESVSDYNTVPIGLGIATTGIVGALGAVAVSEMDDTKKSDFDYDYVPAESKDEVSVPKVDADIKKEVFDSTSVPYRAIRDKRSMDKFYGEDENS